MFLFAMNFYYIQSLLIFIDFIILKIQLLCLQENLYVYTFNLLFILSNI